MKDKINRQDRVANNIRLVREQSFKSRKEFVEALNGINKEKYSIETIRKY